MDSVNPAEMQVKHGFIVPCDGILAFSTPDPLLYSQGGGKKESPSLPPSSSQLVPLCELFKLKPGEWHCELCRTLNTKDGAQCVCCKTPKEGAEPSTKPALEPSHSITLESKLAAPNEAFTFGSVIHQECQQEQVDATKKLADKDGMVEEKYGDDDIFLDAEEGDFFTSYHEKCGDDDVFLDAEEGDFFTSYDDLSGTSPHTIVSHQSWCFSDSDDGLADEESKAERALLELQEIMTTVPQSSSSRSNEKVNKAAQHKDIVDYLAAEENDVANSFESQVDKALSMKLCGIPRSLNNDQDNLQTSFKPPSKTLKASVKSYSEANLKPSRSPSRVTGVVRSVQSFRKRREKRHIKATKARLLRTKSSFRMNSDNRDFEVKNFKTNCPLPSRSSFKWRARKNIETIKKRMSHCQSSVSKWKAHRHFQVCLLIKRTATHIQRNFRRLMYAKEKSYQIILLLLKKIAFGLRSYFWKSSKESKYQNLVCNMKKMN